MHRVSRADDQQRISRENVNFVLTFCASKCSIFIQITIYVFVYLFILFLFFSVFTGCGDNCGRVFDAKSGALKRTFKGHEFAVNAITVCIC